MRQLVRSLPRFIQDPLIEHRWFRRLFGGHFEQWWIRVDPEYPWPEWFPMMACTQADPAWNHLVRLRMPHFHEHVACEEHR